MTAPADWLTGKRPPLPFRERTPLYDQAKTAAAQLLSDLGERERTATLYRVEELTRVLEPVWPTEQPVEDGTVPEMPVVVKPGSWRWFKRNLTWRRQVAGGMSGLVLAVAALGRWFL